VLFVTDSARPPPAQMPYGNRVLHDRFDFSRAPAASLRTADLARAAHQA